MHSISFLFLSALLQQTAVWAGPGDANTFCVLIHCGGKAMGCQRNDACNKVLSCAQACAKGDLTCSEICQTRYGNAQFDDVSQCLISNNCLEPYPKKTFATPLKATTLSLSDFASAGPWFVKDGLDKGLDCYANQSMQITPASDHFAHSITIHFPEGPRVLESTMTPRADGQYDLEYTLGGGGKDVWYVVGKKGSVAVVVYIGANHISNYRGGYVLKQSEEELSDEEVQFVKDSLASSGSGVTYDDFCHALMQ